MKTNRVSTVVFLLSLAFLLVTARESSADQPVDFTNDVIPLLTKSGCNTGACHGAAVGRGGFKLSLYGGDPAADYDAITRQLQGRRVNLSRTSASLVLLKPTEQLEHGGGLVFEPDSPSAKLLSNWIQQGATNHWSRRLVRVEISPHKSVLEKVDDHVMLQSVAHYDDSSQRDATEWTIFTAEDSSAVEIEGAKAIVHRPGRHVVVARFLDQVVPVELIVPLTDKPVDLGNEPRSNFIDDQILATLSTLRLTPSPIADDNTFLRRVTIDLTGRLPSINSVNKPTGKLDRVKLVDQLLQSESFVELWTLKLANLLRLNGGKSGNTAGLKVYHRWLAEQLRRETPYDSIARELILASGDTSQNGPANFYRTVSGPRQQAEFVSELFMASRLRCANCHNHPLDRWTQDDYHGLAAIFAKVQTGETIKAKPRGEVIHPRTLQAAVQRIPGEQFLDSDANDGRKQLVDWLTNADNPYFARSIVNRLWKSMMGRGLVEPVDDFRSTNPATHPKLLSLLADDFIANNYSLRHTLRLIANSTTYARSSDALPANRDDDRFYSHAAKKNLEPEVLADAISDTLGIPDRFGNLPAGTRAVELIDPKTRSKTLDVLGRCDRTESCENKIQVAGGLPQKLHLFNGDLLNARISAQGSRLDKLLSSNQPPADIIAKFYQIALSRNPTPQETQHWNDELEPLQGKTQQQRRYLEDFVWGLMTCEEFNTNH